MSAVSTTVGGLSVSVTGPDDAPPVLLLHGWGMHGGVFAQLAAAWPHRHRLVRVDLPGHGRSRDSAVALDPDAIVDALAPVFPNSVWVGWSMSAHIALAAAACGAATRAVLIAGSASFAARDHWPGMHRTVLQEFASALQRDWRATVDRFLALEALGDPDERAVLRCLRALVFAHGEPDPKALQAGLVLLQTVDQRALLGTIEVPVLCIGGQRDRLVLPAALARTAGALRYGQHVILAGCAHAPMLTHMSDLLAALAPFVAGQTD